MISINQLAEVFENGLNTQLANKEIQFKIWAEAGEYKKPVREGNTIVHNIIGNLRTSTSANDATDLVMGVNGLSLDFKIPIIPPRTNATQTAAELQKIKNGQYPFLQYITNAINGYFQTAQAILLTDESGAEYSVAFQAGTAVTGNVELAAKFGQSVDFNVYIEVYFIKGGVNSKDVKIYFDGLPIPYQAVRYGRSPMLEQDINAKSLVSKNIVTSTAFSIDVDFPANSDDATKSVINYLLSGEPNVAHFVTIKFGSVGEETYLMTINTSQTSSQGIAVAGTSISLIEIADDALVLGIPKSYQLSKFVFTNSNSVNLNITASVDCTAYIAGTVLKLVAGKSASVQLAPSTFEYNEKDNNYEVYVVTDKAVSLTAAGARFVVVKGAGNG